VLAGSRWEFAAEFRNTDLMKNSSAENPKAGSSSRLMKECAQGISNLDLGCCAVAEFTGE